MSNLTSAAQARIDSATDGWRLSIRNYQDDINSGVIEFDANGYAKGPGDGDRWIAEHLAAKLPEMQR
jgi:hypothetical protein